MCRVAEQDRPKLALALLQAVRQAVEVEDRLSRPARRRAVAKATFVKQFEQLEQRLEDALVPLFRQQVKDAAEAIAAMGDRAAKSAADSAAAIVAQAFDPRRYDRELIDRTLPVLARMMAESAVAQALSLGVEPRKANQYPRTKATTASEWLEAEGLEPPPGVATELPVWMVDEIDFQLREAFAQDYWAAINDTTQADIEGFVRRGLQDGKGFAEIAREIRSAAGLDFEYYRRRSLNIARTEGGNALNGARAASIDSLSQEIPEALMRKEWQSALSNTTRDSHAMLDGVPADEEGLFTLNGFRIPWPGHWSLPASDRCNCGCDLVTGFAIDEELAMQRIQEYNERVSAHEEENQ